MARVSARNERLHNDKRFNDSRTQDRSLPPSFSSFSTALIHSLSHRGSLSLSRDSDLDNDEQDDENGRNGFAWKSLPVIILDIWLRLNYFLEWDRGLEKHRKQGRKHNSALSPKHRNALFSRVARFSLLLRLLDRTEMENCSTEWKKRHRPFCFARRFPVFRITSRTSFIFLKILKKNQQSIRAYFEAHRPDSKENFSNLMKWDRITGLTSN